MAPERNSPVSLTTVCGSSSMLAQVTVEPALTVSDTGANMKSFTMILVGSGVPAVDGLQAPHHSIATLTAVSSDRFRPCVIRVFSELKTLRTCQAIDVSLSAIERGCLTTE